MKYGLLLLLSAASFAQTAAQVKVVRAARMLDVVSGKYVSNPVIVVEKERIKSVEAGGKAPEGAEIIDLGNATLLPGLIDCHTHLLQNYDMSIGGDDPNMLLTVGQMSIAARALLGVKMGREDLEAGITTVRDLGNSGHNGDVALRDAINKGWVTGPRMLVSTRALAAAGGQFGGLTPEAQHLVDEEYAVVSGVEEARKAVRQAFYDGADLIKVIVNTGPRVLGIDEMKTIVEEAHRVGKKVAAHATNPMSTRIAADAGVDSIEHAYNIADETLKIMAEKKIFMVPTDPRLEDLDEVMKTRFHMTPESVAQMRTGMAASQKSRIERAIKAGVRIAAGSDMYDSNTTWSRGYASLTVLEAYVDSGMPPIDAIRAATANAADLLGMSRSIGSIEPGRFADLIATPGDPLANVSDLHKVNFVMKGGQIVRR